MVLIFAAVNVPPGAPPNPWEAITCEWIGHDGSTWDIGTGAEGVVLQSGVEGLHEPPVTVFRSQSRAVPGNRRRGFRVEARDVFWPVQVEGTSAEDWNDVYTRFFNSIDELEAGTWRVGHKGKFRYLKLVHASTRAHSTETDPHVMGYDRFAVTLEAPQPYWVGETVERGPWSAPAPVDFIDPAGSPPFHISSSAAFGSAFIPNPGDVPAYPVWRVQGPLSAVELGVDGRIIEVPFAVADGEVLVIDTDPRNVSATVDGVDVTEDLGFQSFAPVQPSEKAILHVEATGSGRVSVSLTPLYKRAY